MGSNYLALIAKLDEFIRKYYLNQLIRGAIYALGGIAAFFMAVALLEHFGRFDTGVRTVLFYSLLAFSAYILGRYIILPLSRLYRLGKVISYEQAASIIGTHFSNVQDKLINVLQLSGGRGTVSGSQALLEASIEQKIADLKPVPFASAVDLSVNRKFALRAGIPVLLLLLLSGLAPQIITDSTRRLVAHDTYFAPPAPFRFRIMNASLQVPAREDLVLEVVVEGQKLPEEVFIESEAGINRLQQENPDRFLYHFKNLSEPLTFRLNGGGVTSEEFTINVVPKPVLMGFSIDLLYPEYTGLTPETRMNQGDLEIPAGTVVTWNFSTSFTGDLSLLFGDSAVAASEAGDDRFRHRNTLLQSTPYTIALRNKFLPEPAKSTYMIQVIPDQHPRIEVAHRTDSLSPYQFYFKGTINDDYGFRNLFFCVSDAESEEVRKIPLKFSVNNNAQVFYHGYDFSSLSLEPGDEAFYYFEVWDNDGVNGSKVARTERMVLRAPSLKELSEMNDTAGEQVKDGMQSAIEQARQMQKEMDDLRKKLMEKQQPGWEEKKQMEELLKKQRELEKNVQQMQQQLSIQFRQMEQFGNPDPELIEKQRRLEELMNQVMPEEMRQMLQEMQKMMEKLNKEQMKDALDKMELNAHDVEKELDRMHELFKQLEVEQKAEEVMDQLKKLAEKEEALSEKTVNRKEDKEKLSREQDQLRKDFEDVRKQMDELEKKNEELEQPFELQKTDQQEEQISREMEQGSQELNRNNRQKASESQKQAAGQMKQMAEQMQQQMAASQQQQQGEDIQALRQLLENLVTLSFDQERVMEEVKTTDRNGPRYNKLMQEQRKLKDDAAMIEDSLFALSKRVPQIDAVVNKEIAQINSNLQRTLSYLEERQPAMAGQRQQYVMTSTNNLALLLSDAVKQMQQQMQQMKSGQQGSCSKPGSSGNPKPGAQQMRQMQQQINQQMQRLKEQMEQEGGNKKGPRGQGGQSSMSEELVKLAARQQAIRQYLQELSEDLEKNGGNKGGLGDLSKKMEETETDLVNKRITQETLKRQQEILTRLLEAEKAEREREMDPKRQSKEGHDQPSEPSPERYFEYQRQKENEAEMLRTVPPQLLPFYRNKVNEYFNNLEK